MNVETLTISPDEAQRKARVYSAIPEAKRTDDDLALLRMYKMVESGGRVIDIAQAFKSTGLHDDGTPKLAIARADWQNVLFFPRQSVEGHYTLGAGGFTDGPRYDGRRTRQNIAVPAFTFDDRKLTRNGALRSPVPHIPPQLRPRYELRNYHILFEATWTVYPVDPFLLRRIMGNLYVVIAEWELTDVEASLLAAIRTV